jgi:hypothetical protein
MPGGGVGGLGTALYFMRKEEERTNDLVQRHRRRMARKARRIGAGQQAVEARLHETEGDLGRTLMLAMTVNQLLLRKGVLTPTEIACVAEAIDVVDGVAFSKLDPAAVRPRPRAERHASADPKEFLRRLESGES